MSVVSVTHYCPLSVPQTDLFNSQYFFSIKFITVLLNGMTKEGSATSIILKNPDPSQHSLALNLLRQTLLQHWLVLLLGSNCVVAFSHQTVERNYPVKSDCLHFQIIPLTLFDDSFSNDSSSLLCRHREQLSEHKACK